MSGLVKNLDSVSAGRGAMFSLALSIGAGPVEATFDEASLLHLISTS